MLSAEDWVPAARSAQSRAAAIARAGRRVGVMGGDQGGKHPSAMMKSRSPMGRQRSSFQLRAARGFASDISRPALSGIPIRSTDR
jgi:hypothetical protein